MNGWIYHSSSLCLYHGDDIRRNLGCQKSWRWRSSVIYTPRWYVSEERFSTVDPTRAFITQLMGWFQQAAALQLPKKIYGWLNNVCAVNFPKKFKGLIVFYTCDLKMGFEYISLHKYWTCTYHVCEANYNVCKNHHLHKSKWWSIYLIVLYLFNFFVNFKIFSKSMNN